MGAGVVHGGLGQLEGRVQRGELLGAVLAVDVGGGGRRGGQGCSGHGWCDVVMGAGCDVMCARVYSVMCVPGVWTVVESGLGRSGCCGYACDTTALDTKM